MLDERIRRNVVENPGDEFAFYNHSEVVAAEEDYVAVRLVIRPESMNPYGVVHGGMLYTLADEATGGAVHTDGRAYVTQSGTLHFLRNASDGEIRAESRVVHRGKSTALANVEITDEAGNLLATGEYTYFCIGSSFEETSGQDLSGK